MMLMMLLAGLIGGMGLVCIISRKTLLGLMIGIQLLVLGSTTIFVFAGISSGATLAAIAQKLPEIPAGSTVLGFNYDTGERYLSVEGFLP